MDSLLCDELVQEIFNKLSPSSLSSASLVSKRWLRLCRSSRTSLSLRLSDSLLSLPSLLSQYPSLSSLSLLPNSNSDGADFETHRRVMALVAGSCPKLTSFRFAAGPISGSSILPLSRGCTQLISISVSLSRPISLSWVARFPALKELSVAVSRGNWAEEEEEHQQQQQQQQQQQDQFGDFEEPEAELGLETVSFSGIESGDLGLNWVWRSCKGLKKLRLRSCEGVPGEGGAFSSFHNILPGLQEMELRTCRTIADGVLSQMANSCDSLNSLLIHDGGRREGLLRFLRNCRCNVQKLDFRLPLDLRNDHLCAAAANFTALSSLCLQSCCLVTGEGLRTLAIATSSSLQELALINCDVAERDLGLLATLGQNLRSLRRLDLSHNDQLLDIGFVSMMVSCNGLKELNLRGCNGLTGAALATLSRCCPNLVVIDVTGCFGIKARDLEVFVRSSRRVRKVMVEESKITEAAKMWVEDKCIEIGA